MYSSERQARNLEAADQAEVERLVAKMEAEMKAAAKQLEFERAAALRDEIQQIRLRVLEQDASVLVARAAERAARDAALPAKERAAAHRPGAGGPARVSPRSRSPRSRCCRRARSPSVARTPTRARWASRRSCSRASATSTTTTTAAGRPAGSIGRPGTDGHSQHPPPDRPAPDASHPRLLTSDRRARLERPRGRAPVIDVVDPLTREPRPGYPLSVWLEPGHDGGGLGAWLVDVPGVFAAAPTPQRALSAILTSTARTREWLEGHGDDLGLGMLGRVDVAGETPASVLPDGYEVNATFPWDRRPLAAAEVAAAVRRLGWQLDDLLALATDVDRFEDAHGPLPTDDATGERTADAVLRHVAGASAWYVEQLDGARSGIAARFR